MKKEEVIEQLRKEVKALLDKEKDTCAAIRLLIYSFDKVSYDSNLPEVRRIILDILHKDYPEHKEYINKLSILL